MSGFAYLGTSAFAAEVLRGMATRDAVPGLVIAPPDRPRGRGRRTGEAPAAAAAADLGIEVRKEADVNAPEAREALAATGSGIAMVCAFGQIVREPLLSEMTLLNVHPSLLPRWRGAAPIERAIMAGDELTGVCIIRLGAELDAGPVAAHRQLRIGERETYGELSERLAEAAGELAAESVKEGLANGLSFEPQASAGATYAEKIEPAERRLAPDRPAAELDRKVRALTPHIGAYLEFSGDDRLGVEAASVPLQVAGEASGQALAQTPGQPPVGRLRVIEGQLCLGCADGILRLDRVKPPGGRAMPAGDFLRGHDLPEGSCL